MAMLLRRRLPLLRLLRLLHNESAASTSSSSTPPPSLQKPHATAVGPGSRRLRFLNATPVESVRGASKSSSAGAYLAIGAAAALASLPVAYADSNEQGAVDTAVSADPAEGEDLARKERKRILELVQSRGMQRGSYPQFDVAVKGQKVVVKFNMPSACNVSHLIVDLVMHIGLEAEQLGGGSEVLVRAWDSPAARQITLNPPKKTSTGDHNEDGLCVLIFEPLIGSDYSEIEFIKRGSFSLKELEALISALKIAGEKNVKGSSGKNTPRKGNGQRSKNVPSLEKIVSDLEAMGVRVYGFDETSSVPMDGTVIWENLAGYEPQKREIEDTILLALQSPEVYDDIARGTRCKFETNRPRAVLFEGPPGTGKTSSARVIAKQAGVPLLYVPLEVVVSKYYGESERLLGSVFSLANDLPEGGIIFLDEVDSFAIARDSEMHEATRRILSVILRQGVQAAAGSSSATLPSTITSTPSSEQQMDTSVSTPIIQAPQPIDVDAPQPVVVEAQQKRKALTDAEAQQKRQKPTPAPASAPTPVDQPSEQTAPAQDTSSTIVPQGPTTNVVIENIPSASSADPPQDPLQAAPSSQAQEIALKQEQDSPDSLFSFAIDISDDDGEEASSSLALGTISSDTYGKLETLLNLLQQETAQLVIDSDPAKSIFKAIRGQVPSNVEEIIFPAVHLESRQLQYQRAIHRIADRTAQSQLKEEMLQLKQTADEKHKNINNLQASSADIRQKISDLSAKKAALLAELEQVETALTQAKQEEDQLPDAIKALQQERDAQARKALALKKKIKHVEGNADEDAKELKEADEIRLRAISAIQALLNSA